MSKIEIQKAQQSYSDALINCDTYPNNKDFQLARDEAKRKLNQLKNIE